MQPVRTLLPAARHLLISPDGQLNLIPFAALVDEQDRYLIERFTLTYLTSGRDLLRLQLPHAPRTAAIVVASPDFGEPARSPQPSRRRAAPVGPRPASMIRGCSSDRCRASPRKSARFGRCCPSTFLVGTRRRRPRWKPARTARSAYCDARILPAPRRAGAASTLWRRGPTIRCSIGPGARRRQSRTERHDDGVLTALEAASLDLWGTKLVVLSACDTGVGEVRNGDGVYGLRRALVLAGTETQMMSLWPVADRSTRDLMSGYYERLTKGSSAATRSGRRSSAAARRPAAHPYHWASFIQSGEWASLDGTR